MLVRTAAALLLLTGVAAAPALAQGQTAPQEAAQAQGEIQPLELGDKAPSMRVQEWLKGNEITSFQPGHVYVVEFWATWCPPCIASIPHLTKLQKEHQGKVTIIGMTTADTRGNTLERVRGFVADPPSEMGYTVAFDEGRETWNRFMAASGQGGLPTSFIVDQQGRVAWIGHPMSMDEPLQQIVDGSYDLEGARAKMRRQTEIQAQAEPMMAQVQMLWGQGDFESALAKIDEIVALDHELFADLAVQKLQVMMFQMNDEAGAMAYSKRLFDEILVKNPDMINGVSWSILTAEGMPQAYLPIGFYGARKANELTGGTDPMVLDTVARAEFLQNQLDAAIATQEKAVRLAKEQGKLGAAELAELEERLAEYREAKGG